MRGISMADALIFRGESTSRYTLWKRATLSTFVDPFSESTASDRHNAVCLFAQAVVDDMEVGRALIAYDVLTGKVDAAALDFVNVEALISEYEKEEPQTAIDHTRIVPLLLPLVRACPVSYATLFCAIQIDHPIIAMDSAVATVDTWLNTHLQKCVVAWLTPDAALADATLHSFFPKYVLLELISEKKEQQFVASFIRESDMRVVLDSETKFRRGSAEIREWAYGGQSLSVWTVKVDMM